eukprot:XP_025013814.1 uncharacterized protein LOC112533708 [Ricinus communis]
MSQVINGFCYQNIKYLQGREAYQLGQVFEENDEAIDDKKEIVVAKLVRLTLKELLSLISLCPRGYHLVFPSLETLTVEGCPQIRTRFTVASNCSIHAETEKPPQIIEEDVAIGYGIAQTTASSRTADEDINWNRCEQGNALPPYLEHEDEVETVQVVEDSSSIFSRSIGTIKSRNLVTKKKKKVKEGEHFEKQDHDSHFQGMGCCLNRGG